MTVEGVKKIEPIAPKKQHVVVEEKPAEVQKADEVFSPAASGGVQNRCGSCPRDYNI